MSLGRRRTLVVLVYFVVALVCCGALSRVIAAAGVIEVVVVNPEPASVRDTPYLQCVPGAAVYRDGATTYVYVVDERAGFLGAELCARRVSVGVADSDDDRVALREGALAGSQRVIVGASRVMNDGDTVRVVPSLRESVGLAATVQADKSIGLSSVVRVAVLAAPAAVAVCLGALALVFRRKSQTCRSCAVALFHVAVLLLLLSLTAVLCQGVVLCGDLLPGRWSDFDAWDVSRELLLIDGGAALLADPADLPGQSAVKQVCAIAWAAAAVATAAGALVTVRCRLARKEERDGA